MCALRSRSDERNEWRAVCRTLSLALPFSMLSAAVHDATMAIAVLLLRNPMADTWPARCPRVAGEMSRTASAFAPSFSRRCSCAWWVRAAERFACMLDTVSIQGLRFAVDRPIHPFQIGLESKKERKEINEFAIGWPKRSSIFIISNNIYSPTSYTWTISLILNFSFDRFLIYF